jgi:hypothetical protein
VQLAHIDGKFIDSTHDDLRYEGLDVRPK